MTKNEARELINMKLNKVYKLVKECEALAEEHKVTFDLSVAYGMGGTYIPEGMKGCWHESDSGWVSSSSMC